MKITILDDVFLDYDKKWLEKLGEVDYYTRLEKEFKSNDDEIIKRIADSEIVVSCKVKMTRKVIESCSNLKYITTSSTGVDHVDVAAARDNGVLVSNIPSYSTMSVAQATASLLLEVVNKVSCYNMYVKNNVWKSGEDFCVVREDLIELDGKTAGIIGYGEIGKATAKILTSLGMNIITYDVNDSKQRLEELYATSDVITLHCPITEDNYHMINQDSIEKMKDGVILLNTSRGPLVNSDDLYEALVSNKVYFAAFDVIDGEPVGTENKLLQLDNFILTPHIAWATKESRERAVEKVCKNIESYLNKEPINIIK